MGFETRLQRRHLSRWVDHHIGRSGEGAAASATSSVETDAPRATAATAPPVRQVQAPQRSVAEMAVDRSWPASLAAVPGSRWSEPAPRRRCRATAATPSSVQPRRSAPRRTARQEASNLGCAKYHCRGRRITGRSWIWRIVTDGIGLSLDRDRPRRAVQGEVGQALGR